MSNDKTHMVNDWQPFEDNLSFSQLLDSGLSLADINQEDQTLDNKTNPVDLAKEIGRLLNSFQGLSTYVPAENNYHIKLNDNHKRQLGASSIEDFYFLAIKGEDDFLSLVEGPQELKNFPQGPQSIKPAIEAINHYIRRLEKSIKDIKTSLTVDHPNYEAKLLPLVEKRAELVKIKNNLVKASKLWPEFKSKSADWLLEAKKILDKSLKLQSFVKKLINPDYDDAYLEFLDNLSSNDDFDLAVKHKPSLTKAASDLSKIIDDGNNYLNEKKIWEDELNNYINEIEHYLTGFMENQVNQEDWKLVSSGLKETFVKLTEQEGKLTSKLDSFATQLQKAFLELEKAEKSINSKKNFEDRERGDKLLAGVAALWRSTLSRRIFIAKLYFGLPRFLGRPVYLEDLFFNTAINLGKAQVTLEELKNQLIFFTGRLSSTHKLRKEAAELQELLESSQNPSTLFERAKHRLNVLSSAIMHKEALKKIEGTKQQNEAFKKEIENHEAEKQHLISKIERSAVEKARLSEELAVSKKNLAEVAKLKASMLKTFERKLADYNDLVEKKQKYENDIDSLKNEQGVLRRKYTRLIECYKRDRLKYKDLNASLKEILNQNHDFSLEIDRLTNDKQKMVSILTRAKSEIEELQNKQKVLEEQHNIVSSQLTASEAKELSLRAELERHQEEIQENILFGRQQIKIIQSYRKKINEIQNSRKALIKAYRTLNERLKKSEASNIELTATLSNREDSLIRLEALKAQLSEQLATANAKFESMAIEKDLINERLNQANNNFQSAIEREKILADELMELKNNIGQEFEPLIEVLSLALWNTQNAYRNQSVESQKTIDNLKLENERVLTNLKEDSEKQVLVLEEKIEELEHSKILFEHKQKLISQAREADIRVKKAYIELENKALFKAKEHKFLAEIEQKESVFKAKEHELLAEIEQKESVFKAKEHELLAEIEQKESVFKAKEHELLTEIEQKEKFLNEKNLLVSNLQIFNEELKVQNKNILSESEQWQINAQNLKLRAERLRSAFKDYRNKTDLRIEELDGYQNTLSSLIENRGNEIESYKARLNNLLPLLAYFINQSSQLIKKEEESKKNKNDEIKIWAPLIYFLKNENQNLIEELDLTQEDRQRMAAERVHLLASQNKMKHRLMELQPLVAFLAKNFVNNIAELAQARSDRQKLAVKLQHLLDYNVNLSQNRNDVEAEASKIMELAETVNKLKNGLIDSKVNEQKLKDELQELKNVYLSTLTELNEKGKSAAAETNNILHKQKAYYEQRINVLEENILDLKTFNQELEISLNNRINDFQKVTHEIKLLESAVYELGLPKSESLPEALKDYSLQIKNVKEDLSEAIELAQKRERSLEELNKNYQTLLESKTILDTSLKSRTLELFELKDQAFILTKDNENLKALLEERKQEIANLKLQFTEEKEIISENSGRLESAWAALNYIGAKAGDAVAKVKVKLDAEIRRQENLHKDLLEKNELIKKLTEKQDRLALIYWTILSSSRNNQPDKISNNIKLLESEEIVELENINESDSDFLGDIKDSAKRGILSLILAGGVVMGLSGTSYAATNYFSINSLTTKPISNLIFKGDAEQNIHLASRVQSRTIGRSVDLSFLKAEDKLYGHSLIQDKIDAKINEISSKLNLNIYDLIDFLRILYPQDATIYFSELENENFIYKLNGALFPQANKIFKNSESILKKDIIDILKVSTSMRPTESFFWDRLYIDLNKAAKNSLEALNIWSNKLKQRHAKDKVNPEFVGLLAPFSNIDNMSPEAFESFYLKHLERSRGRKINKAEKNILAKLSIDIYFSAKFLNLPLTSTVALLEEKLWPNTTAFQATTLEIYNTAAEMLMVSNQNLEYWHKDKEPLCDLDKVASLYLKNDQSVKSSYQRKLSLIYDYNKLINVKSNF